MFTVGMFYAWDFSLSFYLNYIGAIAYLNLFFSCKKQ